MLHEALSTQRALEHTELETRVHNLEDDLDTARRAYTDQRARHRAELDAAARATEDARQDAIMLRAKADAESRAGSGLSANLDRIAELHQKDAEVAELTAKVKELSALSSAYAGKVERAETIHRSMTAEVVEAEERAQTLEIELRHLHELLHLEEAAAAAEAFQLQEDDARVNEQLRRAQHELLEVRTSEKALMVARDTALTEVSRLDTALVKREDQVQELRKELAEWVGAHESALRRAIVCSRAQAAAEGRALNASKSTQVLDRTP